MILTTDQIFKYIKTPQNPNITRAVNQYTQLNVNVNGVGVTEYLDTLQGYENADQAKLRKKRAKSNKHIFSAVLRPMDKILTAKGGSVFLNLPDNQEDRAKAQLSNVRNGESMKDFFQKIWKNKFVTDPNGLIMFEVEDDNTYPTYKSILCIHDYIVSGIVPDYIIFKKYSETFAENNGLSEGDYYRVIDDAFDYVVRMGDESATIIDDLTFDNYFGVVPAFTCSDIQDPNFDLKLSPIDSVIELSDEYMLDGSIHSIYKFLHGFPLYWQILSDCQHCEGSGLIEGNKCGYCGGTGKDIKRDVSKVFGVEPPVGDDPVIVPDVAGYVSPPIDVWQEQRTELDWMETAIEFGIWGTERTEEAKNETATGAFINTQPKNDRLNEMSDTTERLMKTAVDLYLSFYYINYPGSAINLGRRYLIEPPDSIMKRFIDGKEGGMPATSLLNLLIEYYHTIYENQPNNLAKMVNLIKTEPLPHLKIEELPEYVSQDDKLGKAYINDWVASLENQQYLIFSTQKERKQSLEEFIKTKKDGIESTRIEGVA